MENLDKHKNLDKISSVSDQEDSQNEKNRNFTDEGIVNNHESPNRLEEIEKLGAIIVAVVCIVDRMEGAREALAKYPFMPIFTIRDFGIEPPKV